MEKLERHERIITVLLRKIEESNGAEAENARKALERICKKYDLNIEDVLSNQDKRTQREYEYKRAKAVIAQIILRYGGNDDIYINRRAGIYIVDLTDAEHLEVSHAIDVLIPMYRKEMAKIQDVAMQAFVKKHDLYYKGERDREPERIGEEKPKSYEEQRAQLAKAMQIQSLAETMEDVEIHKRLK